MKKIVYDTIQKMNQHNIAGYYVENVNQLLQMVKSLLTEREVIGCGDSITLEETKVFEFIKNGNYIFLDKHESKLSPADRREIYLQNFRADTFISGVNAITTDGELYFIDGNGSRVAPIIYGPKQVILVAGTNKIVSNSDDAIYRIRQIAAPLDAKRLGKNTPCAKIGRCIDCASKERICNDFVCITGQFIKERIKATTDHWMNMSIGSSACHIAISQIQKRNALDVEVYINEDKQLFKALYEKKNEIEAGMGIALDWRELPDKKASRIILEKTVDFADKDKWNEQFDWVMDVMIKMKREFKKYI